MSETPFALFRYRGQEVAMSRPQFDQAVRDGRVCRCGDCVACRAYAYATENRYALALAAGKYA